MQAQASHSVAGRLQRRQAQVRSMLAHLLPLALLLGALCVVTPQEDVEFWMRSGQERLKKTLWQRRYLNKAKNVILFIGDGMGINTVTAARIFQGQRHGGHGEEHVLSFERFPTVGLAKTYNTDKQVPDSAGTATALFTGVKAKYGMVGMDPSASYNSCDPIGDPSRRLPGLARWAQDAGKATGLVTTTRITHATPASLYAHTNHRDWECDGELPKEHRDCVKDIATQLVENEVAKNLKVIMGGGWRQMGAFNDPNGKDTQTPPEGEGCARTDGRNLVHEWLQGKHNALYVNTSEDLKKADLDKVDHLLGLFGAGHIPYIAERGPQHPSLVDMTMQAIKLLQKNRDGYFLMVEAGRIDHGHHKNLARIALQEACELDETVAATLNLIDDKDTLVIVTADHSHSLTFNGYPARGNDILGYAHGAGEEPYETLTYANGPGFFFHRDNSSSNATWRVVSAAERTATRYPHMATVYRKDETHGGEDVAVFATGPWSHLLSGVFEQNYVAHVIAYAASIGPEEGLLKAHLSLNAGGQIPLSLSAVTLSLGSLLLICGSSFLTSI